MKTAGPRPRFSFLNSSISQFLNFSIPMRVLVIGGSGFIGPAIVSDLDRMGCEVAVFHRGKASPKLPDRVRKIYGDRRRLEEFAEELRALGAEIVIDVILSSGRQAEALTHVFRGFARRVVALSSGDVYRACGVMHGTEPGP